MRNYICFCAFFILISYGPAFSQQVATSGTVVRIRIVEEDTKKITPAMVCIANSESQTKFVHRL
jgi:hypothetical protein